MTADESSPAASLVREWADFLITQSLCGPVLDLACGDGRNGLYLAARGLHVLFCDRSRESLDLVQRAALNANLVCDTRQLDLEVEGVNPLPEDRFGAVLVFRYLHRPLIANIRKSVCGGGIVIYETFTVEQPRFGKPSNPSFLLRSGELKAWFRDWSVLHYFEGILENPDRAVAQIVCRKPAAGGGNAAQ
jgi:SAM-dependent methyltransferase